MTAVVLVLLLAAWDDPVPFPGPDVLFTVSGGAESFSDGPEPMSVEALCPVGHQAVVITCRRTPAGACQASAEGRTGRATTVLPPLGQARLALTMKCVPLSPRPHVAAKARGRGQGQVRC